MGGPPLVRGCVCRVCRGAVWLTWAGGRGVYVDQTLYLKEWGRMWDRSKGEWRTAVGWQTPGTSARDEREGRRREHGGGVWGNCGTGEEVGRHSKEGGGKVISERKRENRGRTDLVGQPSLDIGVHLKGNGIQESIIDDGDVES